MDKQNKGRMISGEALGKNQQWKQTQRTCQSQPEYIESYEEEASQRQQ